MNIVRVLMIFAALMAAHISGFIACVRSLHKLYPVTFRTLCEEQRAKDAAKEAKEE